MLESVCVSLCVCVCVCGVRCRNDCKRWTVVDGEDGFESQWTFFKRISPKTHDVKYRHMLECVAAARSFVLVKWKCFFFVCFVNYNLSNTRVAYTECGCRDKKIEPKQN